MHNDRRTVFEFSVQTILILQTLVSYSLKSSRDSASGPFALIQILTKEQANFCHFYNYEQIKYKHGNFQLINQSDRHVFTSFYVTSLLGIALIYVMPHR